MNFLVYALSLLIGDSVVVSPNVFFTILSNVLSSHMYILIIAIFSVLHIPNYFFVCKYNEAVITVLTNLSYIYYTLYILHIVYASNSTHSHLLLFLSSPL